MNGSKKISEIGIHRHGIPGAEIIRAGQQPPIFRLAPVKRLLGKIPIKAFGDALFHQRREQRPVDSHIFHLRTSFPEDVGREASNCSKRF